MPPAEPLPSIPTDPAADRLLAALPDPIRNAAPRITRVSAGMSGAGVYRIQTGDASHVLKVTSPDEPLDVWRRKASIQRHAAAAGIAPRVVHVDEERRAILSEFVAGASFPALYWNPATRVEAVALLAAAIRRVHSIPIPTDAPPANARDFLSGMYVSVAGGGALPGFVGDAVAEVLAAAEPASDLPLVLCHNDANPSNFIYDGTRLLLLDWEVAAPNDPYYDLAAVSLFLRMSEGDSLRLLGAYLESTITALPPRFTHDRRMVALLSGTASLQVARSRGYASAGDPSIAEVESLGDLYAAMRAGSFTLATGEECWRFGLALVKAGIA